MTGWRDILLFSIAFGVLIEVLIEVDFRGSDVISYAPLVKLQKNLNTFDMKAYDEI